MRPYSKFRKVVIAFKNSDFLICNGPSISILTAPYFRKWLVCQYLLQLTTSAARRFAQTTWLCFFESLCSSSTIELSDVRKNTRLPSFIVRLSFDWIDVSAVLLLSASPFSFAFSSISVINYRNYAILRIFKLFLHSHIPWEGGSFFLLKYLL